jgi:hypothetical protein
MVSHAGFAMPMRCVSSSELWHCPLHNFNDSFTQRRPPEALISDQFLGSDFQQGTIPQISVTNQRDSRVLLVLTVQT